MQSYGSRPPAHRPHARPRAVRWLAAFAIAAAVVPHAAVAQTGEAWPRKEVYITVPYAPGGGVDMLARMIGNEVAKKGFPVVVENKAGAGSTVGTAYVAGRPKDGYNLLMANDAYSLAPAIYPTLPYNPKTDLVAVAPVAYAPMLVLVNPASKFKTLPELIKASQNGPALSWGSCGSGTDPHLAGEMMNTAFKMKNVHIPYKGCGPAIADTLGGQLDYSVVTISGAISYVNSGRLIPLAITSRERHKLYPNVPTVAELGAPGFFLSQWQVLMAPAGTPEATKQAIYKTVGEIVKSDAMQKRLFELGYSPANENMAEMQKVVVDDIDKFADLARKINLKAE